MKIAVLDTRGIPNQYDSSRQFAEFLSVDLAKKGHEVTCIILIFTIIMANSCLWNQMGVKYKNLILN